MTVRFYDHAAMMARDRGVLDAAIGRVLDRGLPDWGPELPLFEEELARWCGAGHAVGTISGTQALLIALKALGLGPGDRVATVPNTDSSTPSSIRLAGAVPVYVDIEPLTRCMDPARLDEALAADPGIRAVLAVDMHGHPADYAALLPLARVRGIPVIADACISLGARLDGGTVGTLADVTCVSFGAGKLLGTVGTGGACLTEDDGLARTMRLLSGYGVDRRRPGHQPYESDGLNVRLPELQAAILRDRLPLLDGWIATRRAQAEAYSTELAGTGVSLPGTRHGTEPVWRNYVIGVDDPEGLALGLAGRGIETKRLYAPPIYHEPGFATARAAARCPVAEREAARLLCLPIGPHLDAVAPGQVAAEIRRLTGG